MLNALMGAGYAPGGPGYAQPLSGPNTQFPLNPAGGMQSPQFLGPPAQGYGHMPEMPPWRNSLMDWRQMRPDHQGFTGTPQDWHMGMQDWRNQRPTFGQQPMSAPQQMPGASMPPVPNGQFPTAPGSNPLPPGQMGVNPYQFPTYLGG